MGGSFKGAKAPCRKMGIFKRKAYFQGGWENKEIIYILELLDKAKGIKSKL
jgi:hypothetical protein